MNDIFRYLLGIVLILGLVGTYGYLSVFAFAKARKQEIKKDIAEFGQCCGLETGVCTFQPKIDKLNKIDLQNNAVKNKGSE
jgi:hypothetical protein